MPPGNIMSPVMRCLRSAYNFELSSKTRAAKKCDLFELCILLIAFKEYKMYGTLESPSHG